MAGTNGTNGTVYALSYSRVSGAEHQKQGLSLDFQGKSLRQYVAGQTSWLNHVEYEDVMTGARDDRPAYQQMLSEARRLRKAGESVAVCVTRLDRLGRDLAEAARARKELRRLEVQIHAVAQGGHMRSGLQSGVLMVVAEHEREQIGERVTEIKRDLVEDGWQYGRIPFGYRSRVASQEEIDSGVARKLASGGEPKVFEVDPLTGPVAHEAFARIEAGESVRSVARWLSGLPESQRGNRAWPHQSLTKMLRSATYAGRPSVGAEDVLSRPMARWTPIVTDATWQACQERLSDHAVRPHQAAGSFLLTGFLRCERCGSRMVATSNRQGGRRRSYRCTGHLAGATGNSCAALVSMPKLDEIVRQRLAEVLSVLGVPARLRAVWAKLDEPQGVDVARVRALTAEVSKLQARLANAAALLADGVLDREGYDALRARDGAAIKAAQDELARLQPAPGKGKSLPDVEHVLRVGGGWQGLVEQGTVEDLRPVLSVLVASVRPIRVGFGQYQAHIEWTPLGQALANA